MSTLRRYVHDFKALHATDRILLVLSMLLRLSLLVAFVAATIEFNWTVAFISAVAFIVSFLPWYLSRSYHFHIPVPFEFIIVLFVYATLFLGEIHNFYTKFWWWDLVLHAGSGITIGFLGFLILFSLYRSERFRAQPALTVFLSFSVALAIGAVWEIFEFIMDQTFGFNMQRSGLVDTMWDLIVDMGGALIASVGGYFYLKYPRQKRSRG